MSTWQDNHIPASIKAHHAFLKRQGRSGIWKNDKQQGSARLSHISHQIVSSQVSSPASSSVPKIPRILRATPFVSTTCCMTSIGRSPSCAPWTSALLHTACHFEIKPRRWIQELQETTKQRINPGRGKLDTEHQWEIEQHYTVNIAGSAATADQVSKVNMRITSEGVQRHMMSGILSVQNPGICKSVGCFGKWQW